MNKLVAMQTFVQINDSGSLTGAANTLNTSLPTVVRTLANLEAYLGIRLLNRTTRRVSLTEEGKGYLRQCREILYAIDSAELELSAAQHKPSGKLTVSASVMFGNLHLLPLIKEFLLINNRINIELLLDDSNVNLVEDSVDVAIRIGPLADSSMIAKNVGYINRVVCGTPKLLNRIKPIKKPEDLIGAPCIKFTGLLHGSHWHFYQGSQLQAIEVKGPLECNQIDASLRAVSESMGLGMFLSYQVDRQLKSGELVKVLIEYEPEALPINVVYANKQHMSSRVRVFVDWITHQLRKKLNASQPPKA